MQPQNHQSARIFVQLLISNHFRIASFCDPEVWSFVLQCLSNGGALEKYNRRFVWMKFEWNMWHSEKGTKRNHRLIKSGNSVNSSSSRLSSIIEFWTLPADLACFFSERVFSDSVSMWHVFPTRNHSVRKMWSEWWRKRTIE